MKRIYVAGPYSGPDVITILGNIKRGIELSLRIMKLGYAVYCPWLDWQFGIQANLTKEQYQANSMAWVEVSDAVVLVEGWENSGGTIREISRARQLGIPVYVTFEGFVRSGFPFEFHEEPTPNPKLPQYDTERG